jgi:Cu+-exporting ATPase
MASHNHAHHDHADARAHTKAHAEHGAKPHGHGAGPLGRGGASDLEYTCPMHPEIVQLGPGSCPICGMALEPKNITADAPDDHELKDMTRRFLGSVALSVPLLVIAMGHMFIPALDRALPGHIRPWVELALATPVVLWGGWPFFVRFAASLKNKSLNMFTLIGLGVGVAYVYSVVAVLAPAMFPAALKDAHGMVGVYFEAAGVITALVLLGQVLELRARSRTGAAVRALLGLAPKTARVVTDDGEEEVPVEHIAEGDRLRIRPGEKVPVDALIIEGESAIDESMITGEPIPVDKKPGDNIIGGTINAHGSLVARAARVGSETLLAQIVKQVADAQRSRAPIQKLADQVSAVFVPAVILAAVIALVAWWSFGEPALGIVNAVAVLIIACPCALGLATPISIMVSMGRGASAGILFKDAEAIETLRKIDTIVVDKTGTLTLGKPRLVGVWPAQGFDQGEALRLAASLELGSEHPIGAAIIEGAKARSLPLVRPTSFESRSGKGIRGRIDGRDVVVGTIALLRELGAEGAPKGEELDARRREGHTAMLVAVDGRFAGIVAVADPIKDSTAAALQALRAEHVRVVMLTGDSKVTAQAVAARLGIEEVVAEVLPADKAKVVERLKAEGRFVAMAGDGVNDAPALATAHVGIAMGTGTDVAMHTAHVTLVKGDLRGIARARNLSRATMSNIKQNLFFAFVYNALGVPVAAGILYPSFELLLSPMLAALAMSLSSVSVIANALRLRRVKLGDHAERTEDRQQPMARPVPRAA